MHLLVLEWIRPIIRRGRLGAAFIARLRVRALVLLVDAFEGGLGRVLLDEHVIVEGWRGLLGSERGLALVVRSLLHAGRLAYSTVGGSILLIFILVFFNPLRSKLELENVPLIEFPESRSSRCIRTSICHRLSHLWATSVLRAKVPCAGNFTIPGAPQRVSPNFARSLGMQREFPEINQELSVSNSELIPPLVRLLDNCLFQEG